MKFGHFQVLSHPTVYEATRIRSVPEVVDAVRQSAVSLRGWDFPHTDKENAVPFANGFQSTTIWARYVEGYRMHQSGLFLWKRAFWEDVENKKSRDGRPVLSFISTIWSFAEFLIFLSRFYERVASDGSVRFVITLRGCNGRELAAFDPMIAFPDGYVAHDDVIEQQREIQVAELRASHMDIAAAMVKHLFHVFGWLNLTDAMIAKWQVKLIKKQF